ncbi:glycosyltransferase family 4 protein [Nostoc commune]|uniref:glycosyltransferase family 4 protein n=1 Tax=Nostoc commune TaxID=1178 RepID=UPI0018C6AE89|nr:glycosyltransferase family 4 protein [Nostoc commune]MBG1260437.1 glycosyltransferase family 4 protein [Nostoc commune BAE]
MKIAIVNTTVPFIYGGAEFLADSLQSKLIEYGHQALVIRIPFKWYPASNIVDHMLACRLIKLENIDRVIALKFPSYYVKHPNKVLWLLHQFRQAYDLWGTPYQDIPNTPEGLKIRETIIHADNIYLQEAKKIYTNSHVVSNRLKRFNGFNSEILYPPLIDPHLYSCQSYGDYIFYPSRISGGKRQDLVVESFKFTKTNVKLVIAGNADTPEDLTRIESLVDNNNLTDNVKILSKFISQEEKAHLFANALGCAYIPYDEDSYGYVTLESYQSRKPVITCTDSGGTSVVVKDGLTGYVVAPEPQAIAAAIDRLFINKNLTKSLGEAGYEHLMALNITWDNVIQRLTQ